MKILAIQNKMGIGDTVIFLPYIQTISKKFNSPISLLVKESSKADQFLNQTKYIDEILFLERNNENKKHEGIKGGIILIQELKKYKFKKVFIFNSSLRFNIITKLAGINEIYQYPLFQKKKQHITQEAKNLIKKTLNEDVIGNPDIQINQDLVVAAISKFKMQDYDLNILLGIGGSGPTKRIPSKTFIDVIEKISKIKKCKFYLATGKNPEEQIILNEIINSGFKDQFERLDNMSINDTLPIIKNCNISICNDSSFSHLSAALGIKTITLMADTPLIYGSYNTNMYPIIPDGENTVTHNTLGKARINPNKIFNKLIEILN